MSVIQLFRDKSHQDCLESPRTAPERHSHRQHRQHHLKAPGPLRSRGWREQALAASRGTAPFIPTLSAGRASDSGGRTGQRFWRPGGPATPAAPDSHTPPQPIRSFAPLTHSSTGRRSCSSLRSCAVVGASVPTARGTEGPSLAVSSVVPFVPHETLARFWLATADGPSLCETFLLTSLRGLRLADPPLTSFAGTPVGSCRRHASQRAPTAVEGEGERQLPWKVRASVNCRGWWGRASIAVDHTHPVHSWSCR